MRIAAQIKFQPAVEQQIQRISVRRDDIMIHAAVDVLVGIGEIEGEMRPAVVEMLISPIGRGRWGARGKRVFLCIERFLKREARHGNLREGARAAGRRVIGTRAATPR